MISPGAAKCCARCGAESAKLVTPAKPKGIYRSAALEIRLCEPCRFEVRAALVPKRPRWTAKMPMENLGRANGLERSVGWAHRRAAFVIWLRSADLSVTFEIPLGLVAHKFELIGADLDDARLLWEMQNTSNVVRGQK